MSDQMHGAENDAPRWPIRACCGQRHGGVYCADDDTGWHCYHEWMLRPESDTWECLVCGVER